VALAGTTPAVDARKSVWVPTRRHVPAAVVAVSLVVTLFTGTARADQGSTQSRADQLASQIARSGARIHDLTVQFQRASQQAATASSQLADAHTQFDGVQRQVDAGRALLRQQAVNAYVADAARGVRAPSASKAAISVLLRREYLTMATGDVTDTLDQLRIRLQTLQADQVAIDQAQQLAQRSVDQAAQARAAALAAADKLEGTLAQVKGDLARQVAEAAARKASRRGVALLAAHRPSGQGLPVRGGVSGAVKGSTSPGGGRDVWYELRMCESSDTYTMNSGNGYYGAYQFDPATWTNIGYPGRPDLEPPAMQDEAARKLQAMYGWGQWPACSAALGLT
jgi:hypothetical protein